LRLQLTHATQQSIRNRLEPPHSNCALGRSQLVTQNLNVQLADMTDAVFVREFEQQRSGGCQGGASPDSGRWARYHRPMITLFVISTP